MIDTPVVVRAKLASMEPIEGQPKLSELRFDVLETFRGDTKRTLRVPIETSQEGHWAKQFVASKKDFLLFLTSKPRGYQQPHVQKIISRYQPPLYFASLIDLDNRYTAFSLSIQPIQGRRAVLKKIRELAKEKLPQPKLASFTFRLPNSDSLTVPLNQRMEDVAQTWAKSPDIWTRRSGETVLWGFKRHRNKPFESGYWYAKLKSPGGDLRFGMRIDRDKSGKPYVWIINGSETIRVEDVSLKKDDSAEAANQFRLRIDFPYYDSAITANVDRKTNRMKGVWRKRAGKDKWSELPFSASMESDRKDTDYSELQHLYGRWRVKFSSSDDPAVAVIDSTIRGDARYMDVRRYEGTVLTTTGDYRFLAGDFVDGKLELSVFDGAHAFLFRAELVGEGKLKGDFWSRDSWHETWTATRDEKAKLPDAFVQTRWTGDAKLADMRFPDLNGKLMSLADKAFAGKVRIITVFGSWCPNCHDSALYLASLHKKYASKGLSIVGLAFELTGDFERDAEQVRRYMKRHKTPYPVLLAGLSDKKKASKTLPILDRVRSYPTTIFLNAKNEVISIHTGFTGPATGQAYEDLKARFEAIIEKQLKL